MREISFKDSKEVREVLIEVLSYLPDDFKTDPESYLETIKDLLGEEKLEALLEYFNCNEKLLIWRIIGFIRYGGVF